MGKKDASATRLPVDQYRKQIGKQDYKKTKSALKATRLKAEAKKSSSGFRVRLAWSLYPHVFSIFPLPVCLSPSPILLACLSAKHLFSICLSVQLPV
uniref:Triple QxxK/R motif-containing protein n=1 Tax=Acanthochromis polyacanthus TaxID=80966 RepID=A0A3Q1FG24_9TELE